jgi:hypothetical protein
MQYAPSKSMGKVLISLLRTFKKSNFDLTNPKYKSLFTGLNYNFAKKKAINKFKTSGTVVNSYNINRYHAYSKYNLGLFFLVTYEMPYKSVRLFINKFQARFDLNSFMDLFLLLDRKVDFFFKNVYGLDTIETNALLKNKIILLNGIAITNYKSQIISSGQFFTLKVNNNNISSFFRTSVSNSIFYDKK